MPAGNLQLKPALVENGIRCKLLLWVRSTGAVQVGQVVTSPGTQRLDDACLNIGMGQGMKPAVRDAKPVDDWLWLSVNLVLELPHAEAARIMAHPAAPTAQLARDQVLKVDGVYYPQAALLRREQGATGMRVRVEADGTVSRVGTAGPGSSDRFQLRLSGSAFRLFDDRFAFYLRHLSYPTAV